MGLPPATTSRITMQFQAGGSTHFAYCIYLVENSTSLDPDQVASRVRVAFGDSLDSVMTEDWSVRSTKALNASGAEFTDTAAISGDVVDLAVAPNTALLLKKYTGFAGRSMRGRMYLPGVPEDKVNVAGSLDVTYVADVDVACADFLAKLEADDVPLALEHRDPVGFDTVTGFVCDPVAATQRRRLR